MQRVKTATAVTNKPPYSEAGVPAFFTSGDAVAGIPATAPGQDFFNMVQEELLNLIKAAGLTPSAVDDTQLREAVFQLILAAVAGHNASGTAHADIRAALAGISIPAASETVAGIIKKSTNAQALAGVDDATAMSPADVAAAIAGVVRGYTRQQYPMRVDRLNASGNQAVDCDLHQALAISATGNLIMDEPTHMAAEKWVTLRFYSASAATISWASAWKGGSTMALPTALTAGKWLTCAFVCFGSTMQLMGMIQEA